ncbi:MAG: hypothetical protein ACI8UZ_001456, partial [Akkermansiaceae bacterium]
VPTPLSESRFQRIKSLFDVAIAPPIADERAAAKTRLHVDEIWRTMNKQGRE